VYVWRPYQLVRSRRLNLPAGQLEPQRRLAPASPAPIIRPARQEPVARPVHAHHDAA
jgi:hypothetical protein